MPVIVPVGTRIYLTKRTNFNFVMPLDTAIIDDVFFVAYDIKINGIVIIPRGTRVWGDWVSEIDGDVNVQLQLSKIYLGGIPRAICADSEVISAAIAVPPIEPVSPSIAALLNKQAVTNLYRVPVGYCQCVVTYDPIAAVLWLNVRFRELPVTIIVDFII